MKKAVILVLCLSLLAVFTGCEKKTEFTSGEYEYRLNDDGTAILTAYHGEAAELTLPSSLDGHPITGIYKRDLFMNEDFVSVVSLVVPEGYTQIGHVTFERCTKLTSVKLPDTLTKIDVSAFSGCTNLTSVKLPDTLTEIGASAFSGCESLGEIALPQSPTTLGAGSFAGTALESVTIPDGTTWDISGGNPFANCKRLRTFVVSDQHPTLCWKDGVLLSLDETALVVYPAGREDLSYTLPETVQTIGSSAFSGAPLREITLPEGLTAVTAGAFFGCAALETAVLPDQLTDIGDSAFSGCGSLTSLQLPDSVQQIGDSAFYGCDSLKSLQLPAGLQQIGKEAFANCAALETLAIPKGVQEIGASCFERSPNVTLEVASGSVAEAYAKENKIPWAYQAASRPEAPTDQPQGTSPSTFSDASLPTLDWPPVPAKNETVYVGEGQVSQAEKIELGFILSADQQSIRDLTIRIEGLNIEIKFEGGRTTLTGGTVLQKNMKDIPLNGITPEIDLNGTKITNLYIFERAAFCDLQYVYHYEGSDNGAPAMDVPFDMTHIELHVQ